MNDSIWADGNRLVTRAFPDPQRRHYNAKLSRDHAHASR
jgi:hypothetical protein